LEETSTGLQNVRSTSDNLLERTNFAAPKGFALGALGLEASFGEDRGDGLVELVEERGSSSSFLRLIWGVGGVELLAVGKHIQPWKAKVKAILPLT
jgi:hypothetical protein